MRYLLFCLALCCFRTSLPAQSTDTRCYELRIYTAAKGKLNALQKRFREHTMALFENHGMTNVGYWMPLDNPDEKLYYVLSYPDRAAREASWAAFLADTTWQRVSKESEADGALVAHIDNVFLKTTDFSPNNLKPSCGQVWELRTYTATPNNLEHLLSRFRNHTLALFEKFGMTNRIYWTPTDPEQGSANMLYYFLSHPSQTAGLDAFDRFRKDPEWLRVRQASEVEGGGSLTVKVESLYLFPTDFSPLK